MAAGFGRGAPSARQGFNADHMNGPVQRQRNDGTRPHLGMGARNSLAIDANMALFDNFLRKTAGFRQAREEQKLIEPHRGATVSAGLMRQRPRWWVGGVRPGAGGRASANQGPALALPAKSPRRA